MSGPKGELPGSPPRIPQAAPPAHLAEDVRPLWETCSLCNYDRHRCPGCGIDVPHGTYACDECNRLAAQRDGTGCAS